MVVSGRNQRRKSYIKQIDAEGLWRTLRHRPTEPDADFVLAERKTGAPELWFRGNSGGFLAFGLTTLERSVMLCTA